MQGFQRACRNFPESRGADITLRVQVPNYHILSKYSNLHNYYPKTEYLFIGSFGPLGLVPTNNDRTHVIKKLRAEPPSPEP